jgi:hypothetical protein
MAFYAVTVKAEIQVKARSTWQALERARDSKNWVTTPTGPGWQTDDAMGLVTRERKAR